MFKLAELNLIMPNIPETRLESSYRALSLTMEENQINTITRAASFLAQLAHESAEFKYMEEIASGDAYEGRVDLGNLKKGDGRLFKGRGPIQLTGRANYRRAGGALGLDLEANPQQVAEPRVGFRVAGWFWTENRLNTYADTCDFRGQTRRINGGYNGYAERLVYFLRALQVLGNTRVL